MALTGEACWRKHVAWMGLCAVLLSVIGGLVIKVCFARVEESEQAVAGIESRLRAIEQQSAAQSQILQELMRTTVRIEAKLDAQLARGP